MGCSAVPLTRLTVVAGASQSGIPIPKDALSLVIHNPSYVTLLIAWGGALDPGDSRSGYYLALPGTSLCSIPIPQDASQFSIAWVAPPSPDPLYFVLIDETGADVITIMATPNNKGTFIGQLTSNPVPTQLIGM